MTMDLAGHTDGPRRNTLLGIAQVIMQGELAVNRALDRLDPIDDSRRLLRAIIQRNA